jgi:hypothetical protein
MCGKMMRKIPYKTGLNGVININLYCTNMIIRWLQMKDLRKNGLVHLYSIQEVS